MVLDIFALVVIAVMIAAAIAIVVKLGANTWQHREKAWASTGRCDCRARLDRRDNARSGLAIRSGLGLYAIVRHAKRASVGANRLTGNGIGRVAGDRR